MPRFIPFCSFLLLAPTSGLAAAPPEVEVDGDSRGGNVTVSWQAPEEHVVVVFQVQEATSPGFEQPEDIYQGTHTARVISGLRDGTFHYRARYQTETGWTAWSEAQKFEVEHPSLASAGLLFVLGAVVFSATAFVVLRGVREVGHD